jgi:hypothetical protein
LLHILTHINPIHFIAFYLCKIDLKEIGCDDMDWIDVGQDRDQWRALVNHPVP